MSAVLDIRDLSVSLPRAKAGNVAILDGLNLTVEAGQMLALVGESGSGKTIAALSVMRLLPDGAQVGGQVLLDGMDLTRLDEAAMRRVRGRRVGMVFQNPLAALNPSRTVASQIGEAWRVHQGGSARAARARALELLGEAGIVQPAARLDDYPHQFSGGMRQRVMIAMALACSPKLLIADEPTTGLDPLIAQQIMALIARLRRELEMGVLFVTHDLSVVEAHADAVHVLYAGKSVEWGDAKAFFGHPRHPYSEALLGSVARVGMARLQNIPGNLPEPEARPPGCRFAPRCGYHKPECDGAYPAASAKGGRRRLACIRCRRVTGPAMPRQPGGRRGRILRHSLRCGILASSTRAMVAGLAANPNLPRHFAMLPSRLGVASVWAWSVRAVRASRPLGGRFCR